MKAKFTVILSLVFLLLISGSAGAQGITTYPVPQLLPGALIPQFIDPLPVAGITLIDATVGPGPVPYNITMAEFQANILPTTANIPLPPPAPAGSFLPANTPTWVWGYLTDTDSTATPRPSYLGPIVVAARGIETQPTYINALPNGVASQVQGILPIDQTLDWANPQGLPCKGADITNPSFYYCTGIYDGPHPAVPHIHGGEVAPAFDGGPDAWWIPDESVAGGGFVGTTFSYPNKQQAGTIWFHDHALGITRLNVFGGLAGVHIIKDTANEPPQAGTAACTNPANPFGGCLPDATYDIPLIIQDRSFDVDGNLYYNLASNPQPNLNVHPYWIPEFIGDTIVVNGKTWPFFNVEPRKYRFRLLNGSNARFYDLTLASPAVPVILPGQAPPRASKRTRGAPTLPFIVIATDDGYLNTPVSTPNVIIGPGERYEVIVDFTGLTAGTELIMKNSARTPFPGGAKPVAGTTDTVMKFIVTTLTATPDAALPTNLRPNNPIADIKTPAVANRPVAGACPTPGNFPATNTIVRQLTLNEVIGPGGPLELVLNNTVYNPAIGGSIYTEFNRRDSEQPAVGDTEIWEIINITADAHPIHTHLASFQMLSRQSFSAAPWMTVYQSQLTATYGLAFDAMGPPNLYLSQNTDCAIGGNPAIGPYLTGFPKAPSLYEQGWKDTAISYPGEVLRIVIRWAETDAPATVVAAGPGTPPNPLPVPQCVSPCGPDWVDCIDTTTYPDAISCVPVAGSNTYPFGPFELLGGVGYVWHCHIIDHEDNEMMRPYIVNATRQTIN